MQGEQRKIQMTNEFFDCVFVYGILSGVAFIYWCQKILRTQCVCGMTEHTTGSLKQNTFFLHPLKEITLSHVLCQRKAINCDYKWYCDILICQKKILGVMKNIWPKLAGNIGASDLCRGKWMMRVSWQTYSRHTSPHQKSNENKNKCFALNLFVCMS